MFQKLRDIVVTTAILEPAISPCSSCRHSWQYWLWAEQQGSDFRQWQVFFSLSSLSDKLLGPFSLLSNRYPGLFPWRQSLPERECGQLPSFTAGVKSSWNCPYYAMHIYGGVLN